MENTPKPTLKDWIQLFLFLAGSSLIVGLLIEIMIILMTIIINSE